MAFTKPPFLQWPVAPVAARGLGAGAQPTPPGSVVIINAPGSQFASGWFDYQVPAGYVPGAGLIIDVTCSETSPFLPNDLFVSAVNVDGDYLTNAVFELNSSGQASIGVGQTILIFCDAVEQVHAVPDVETTLSFALGASNRNCDGWSTLNPGAPATGSGGAVVAAFGAAPPAPGPFPWVKILPFAFAQPFGFQNGDLWIGGVAPTAGPAPGTVTYGPGDRLSIGLYWQPRLRSATITDVRVNAGAGGVEVIDLRDFKVASGVSVPPGRPRAISAATDGPLPNARPWVLQVIGPQPPTNTIAPVITGTHLTSGALLLSSLGTWTGSPTSYARQWRLDGVDVPGKVANTFIKTPAMIGKVVDCVVTATNAAGSGSAPSNAIGPLIADPAGDRVTADTDPRVTADGDQRITE